MKTKIRNILNYGGVSKNEYISITPDIIRYNRETGLIFSILAMLSMVTMIALTYLNIFTESRIAYVIGACGALAIAIMFFAGKWAFQLTEIATYLTQIFYIAFGYFLCVFLRTNEQSTVFIIMLVIVPWLFITKPKFVIVESIGWILIFTVSAIIKKPKAIYTIDIVDVIIFSIFSMISCIIVICNKIKSFRISRNMGMMSTTDKMTGLNNRNCYEWQLDSYPDKCKTSLCCIYIDINGLHDLNNTQGHAAGDKMLITIAKIVQDVFGEYDTYRIGGDEYVAFVLDKSTKDINDMIKELKTNVEYHSYHIAVGYDFQKQENIKNIQDVVKTAEKRMYISKENYYKEINKEHR